MNAWMIVSGEYSDYSVHAVCTDPEVARQLAASLRTPWGRDCTVEPIELYDEMPPITLSLTYDCRCDDPDDSEEEETRIGAQPLRVTSLGYALKVEGSDHERVRKVYSERRAKLIALPWLTMSVAEIAEALGKAASEGGSQWEDKTA